MTWMYFHDCHSGGKAKTKYEDIFIELPRQSAIQIFKKIFRVDPEAAYCRCCGRDYQIETVAGLRSPKLDIFYRQFSGKHSLESVFAIDKIRANKILREK